jgi:multiple sugar transport system permease protein
MIASRQRWLFLSPFILTVVPFVIWPALFGFFTSFTNYTPFGTTPIRFVGLQNYSQVLASIDFQKSMANMVIFTFITLAMNMLLGILIAYALRTSFRGRSFVRFVLLIPWLISPIANGLMWRFLLKSSAGLPPYLTALAGDPGGPNVLRPGLALLTVMVLDIWRKVPLVTFLVLPGVESISNAYWDLAALEGMNLTVRLRHIIFPHLRVLLLTVALLLIGDALGTSESLLMLTGGGPGTETMMPGLFSYQQAVNVFDWTSGATSAWLIAAVMLFVGIVYVVLVRHEPMR